MKKQICYILFLFYSSLTFSQEFEGFIGYVVTKNNDTINCKYAAISNIFYKQIFNPSRLRNKVEIINNNVITKYKPNELNSFVVFNPRGTGDFKFVSTEIDKYNHFYQEIVKGKITLLRIYDQDSYANEISNDIFIKDYKMFKIGSSSFRKKIGELIADYPELYEEWMDAHSYYKTHQIEEVLKIYNNHFENKK